jgi:hypothetical protein
MVVCFNKPPQGVLPDARSVVDHDIREHDLVDVADGYMSVFGSKRLMYHR